MGPNKNDSQVSGAPLAGLAEMPLQNWKFLNSLRWRAFKSAFKITSKFFLQSGPWRDPLIESLSPRAGERILDVSVNGWSSGIDLARRFPAVQVVSLGVIDDLNRNGVAPFENIRLLDRNECHIGCPGASIDKIVCSLGLHPLQPEQKAFLLREMLRVLRHGGSLHIADYDRPRGSLEASMLKGTSRIYGERTALAHFDGTWVDMINKAGFVGVRRLASYPDMVGRISLVRARRQ